MAERLGSGLQNRVQQFKSATDLTESSETPTKSKVSELLVFERGADGGAFRAHVKSKVDLLFSAVSARFFSGENLCNSK